jgi:2-dehydro-3-deoxy-L-rhamnonate dehydrogenase (NAD+)
MNTRMDGQVAIVTGATRGIGLGIARVLAERGCRIVAWGREINLLQSQTIGFKPVRIDAVDITDFSAVDRAFGAAVSAFGQVHILVNNAGINGPILPVAEYPIADWDKVIATDLTSTFYTCRLAAPHMREKDYGRIVNITSIVGKEGIPNISAYSAAKAGVIGFTKGLAKELSDCGVTVNCVAPAMTVTDMIKDMAPERIEGIKAKIPMGRLATVEDVAETVAWVASPACGFTTGFVFDVTGGRADY